MRMFTISLRTSLIHEVWSRLLTLILLIDSGMVNRDHLQNLFQA
jgi:hypothetical protein